MLTIFKMLGLFWLVNMVNDAMWLYRPGKSITAQAAVALTGKRLCAISGNRTSGPGLSTSTEGSLYQVGLPVAGGRVFGVVGYDVPSGGQVPVKRSGVITVTAGAAIAAEQEVEALADGRIQPVQAGNFAIGVVHTAVALNGDAEFEQYQSPSKR